MLRSQAKRDRDEERKYLEEQSQIEWDRNEWKRKLDADLIAQRMAESEAKQRSAEESAASSRFARMAGKQVGTEVVAETPEGLLARTPVGVSPNTKAQIAAADRRHAARLAAGLAGNSLPQWKDPTYQASQLEEEASNKLADLAGRRARAEALLMVPPPKSAKDKVRYDAARAQATADMVQVLAEEKEYKNSYAARSAAIAANLPPQFTGPTNDYEAALVEAASTGKPLPPPPSNEVVNLEGTTGGGGERADKNKEASKIPDKRETLPTPKTKEEFDKLKSGDQFLAPDGTVRIKP